MAGPLLSDRWPDGDARRVLIFRALVEVYQADPVLASLGLTVRAWTGDARDAEPPAKGELPWLRLTPVGSSMRLESEDAWEVVMRVKFELATEGTAWDDLGNLSSYLAESTRYNRVTGAGLTVLNALRAAGATVYDFEESGLSATHAEASVGGTSGPSPPAATDLTSQGILSIRFNESALD